MILYPLLATTLLTISLYTQGSESTITTLNLLQQAIVSNNPDILSQTDFPSLPLQEQNYLRNLAHIVGEKCQNKAEKTRMNCCSRTLTGGLFMALAFSAFLSTLYDITCIKNYQSCYEEPYVRSMYFAKNILANMSILFMAYRIRNLLPKEMKAEKKAEQSSRIKQLLEQTCYNEHP